MKSNSKILALLFCASLAYMTGFAQQKTVSYLEYNRVNPTGWLSDMLDNQSKNYTGNLVNVGFPFNQGGWGSNPFMRTKKGVSYGFWVPYEQTAYYYDGMLRCGLICNDSTLLAPSRAAIYNSINQAKNNNGVIGAEISIGEMRRWPHAVFFRAFMAEYESTYNPIVLEALEQHYHNDTVKFVGRDLCNIEILTWLYHTTGDNFYKQKVLSYEDAIFKEGLEPIIQDFASDKRQEVHAVTFYEFLKIPICYYELTGKRKYIDMVRNAFSKADKYSMLPDGITSGEEGLSGNTSINTHEMCNVIDYMWTCSYMLRLTQEVEWSERIERALFNAGLGGITKNFDAHQYYSAPNQIACAEHSSIVSTYTTSRMSYRQIHRPPCCTGNLNRMLPIYAGSQWLSDGEKNIYKMLYGAGKAQFKLSGQDVELEEQSNYPFGNTILLTVAKGSGRFTLHLNIPTWSVSPEVKVNGATQKNVISGQVYAISREFKQGDKIEISLPKKAQFKRWNYESMVVNYGPLLFALPVQGTKEQIDVLTPKLQAKSYKGYEMVATSTWNYILGVNDEADSNLKVIERELKEGENPWNSLSSPIEIVVPAFKDNAWTPEYKKTTTSSGDEIYSMVTPKIPARGAMIYALNGLKPQAITLVPYGRTLLRISMFPFWKQGYISPEILATDTKN